MTSREARRGRAIRRALRKSGVKLYKVTTTFGGSIYNPGFPYNLPKRAGRKLVPGAWHVHKGPLRMCKRGFHVTTHPDNWRRSDSRLFEVEVQAVAAYNRQGSKLLVRRMRLVREIHSDSVLAYGFQSKKRKRFEEVLNGSKR